jgi:hypothetical protein
MTWTAILLIHQRMWSVERNEIHYFTQKPNSFVAIHLSCTFSPFCFVSYAFRKEKIILILQACKKFDFFPFSHRTGDKRSQDSVISPFHHSHFPKIRKSIVSSSSSIKSLNCPAASHFMIQTKTYIEISVLEIPMQKI